MTENLRAKGFGLGLRPVYYDELRVAGSRIDWLEAITENFLVPGGKPLAMLEELREDFPLRLHGVSLSIASADPLDFDYLGAVKALAARFEPELVSDHLAWTGIAGRNSHDLLPAPLTRETLEHCVARVGAVQDFLGRRIALENPSTYVAFAADELDEAEFLAELARRADCLLLLDVNNIVVSGFNHGFAPEAYLDRLPGDRIAQIHVAGHSRFENFRIDTHDQPVCDEVFALFALARRKFGPVPAMIERDDHFPPFEELLAELEQLRALAVEVDRRAAA